MSKDHIPSSSAFEGIDIDVGTDNVMHVYKKGEAPLQLPNFPDVFGVPATYRTNRSGNTEPEILQDTNQTSTTSSSVNPEETEENTSRALSNDASTMLDRSTSPRPTAVQDDPGPTSLRETVRAGVSKRSDFPLVRQKCHLIIIDVQRHCSQDSEEGSFYQKSLRTMCSNIPKLIQAFRSYRDTQERGCEVIFSFLQSLTRDGRDISLDYKLSGPSLANIPNVNIPIEELFLDSIMPEIHLGKGDILIPKTSCSVFVSTNIDYVLRNLHTEQLVICGQLTDQCVESAVRDAADLGYLVTVVRDACAAQSEEAEMKGLKGMHGFCRLLSTQEVLEELGAEQKWMPHCLSSFDPLARAAKDPRALRLGERLAQKAQQLLNKSFTPEQEMAFTVALLHSLKSAGVEFLRFFMVDATNTVRCKAVPLDHLLKKSSLNYQISVATVVMAGLPSFADAVTEGTGLGATGVMIVQPDLSTLRVLPYAPKSALVLGNLHDPSQGGTISNICTRGLLQRVTRTARDDFGIEFCVGAEIEFCLHDLKTGKPVDNSVFCSSTTLNEQEAFISDLCNQLKKQMIPIEMVHAESAPGQLEIVISYQQDPVRLSDYVILTKETIRAVSRAHSLKALFLPKIRQEMAGNGLHLHISFNDLATQRNVFSSTQGLSDRGQSFLEGILTHLPGLLALTVPTTNSFRRIGPNCWTGSQAEWAVEDKEAALRVCSNLHSNEWEHVEYKLNDSSSNIYLGLSGILICGLDGIDKCAKLRPPRSETKNATGDSATLPESIEKSLDSLEQDELLLDLMGPTLSKSYVALRRAEAARASKMTLEDEVKEELDKA